MARSDGTRSKEPFWACAILKGGFRSGSSLREPGLRESQATIAMPSGGSAASVVWGGNWFGGSRYGTVDAELVVCSPSGSI